MPALIEPIDGTSADPSVLGGKAANLARLIAAGGFPIPASWCLTTDAYQQHVSRLVPGDGTSTALQRAIVEADVDPDLRASLDALWRQNSWVESGTRVAIRSSATSEDRHEASFAGQYRSFLNVATPEDAIECIKSCWASLWGEHAITYRSQNVTDPADMPRMAVLVQEMAPSDFAGVAFSIDPLTGDAVAYVEGLSGLGEPLVSGEAGPEIRAWLTLDGKPLRIDYLVGDGSSAPSPADLGSLACVIGVIAQRLGGPQDIEWTWHRTSGVRIVQARPVVRHPSAPPDAPKPWVLIGRPAGGWSADQDFVFGSWDEYNARSIYPLDWDLFDAAAWEANLRMFDDRGTRSLHVEDVAVEWNGVVVGIDPSGRQNTDGRAAVRVPFDPIVRWEETLSAWDLEAAQIRADMGDLDAKRTEDVLRIVERAAGLFRRSFCARMASMSHWIQGNRENDPVESDERRLRALLATALPPTDLEDAITELQSGIAHDTARMNDRMLELRSVLAAEPTLLDSPEFGAKVTDFLREFGHFQFDNRTLAAHPDVLWSQLRVVAPSATGGTNSSAGLARFERRLSSLLPLVGTERGDELIRIVTSLRYWIAMRETSKTKQSLAHPLLERLFLELGCRLVANGHLGSAEDVRLLHWDEVRALFGSADPDLESTLARRRRALAWKSERSWLPQGFHGGVASADGLRWSGEPGSPGTVTGPARRVADAAAFGTVCRGDVVIAYTTNPMWTQLFGRAAAVVVERGGRTSHAAVVAREYGIPAVLGLPGIFEALTEGEMVTVDGTNGLVTRRGPLDAS